MQNRIVLVNCVIAVRCASRRCAHAGVVAVLVHSRPSFDLVSHRISCILADFVREKQPIVAQSAAGLVAAELALLLLHGVARLQSAADSPPRHEAMEELAHDFLAETEALCELLAPLPDAAYVRASHHQSLCQPD